MIDINELITRLQGLTEPCRECDAALFNVSTHLHYPEPMEAYDNIALSRYLPRSRWRCKPKGADAKETDERLPKFTASIDAALTLVPDNYNFSLDRLRVIYLVSVSARLAKKAYASEHKSLPIAICIAALSAVQSSSDQL